MKLIDYLSDKIVAIIMLHVCIFMSVFLLFILRINQVFIILNELPFYLAFWICLFFDFLKRRKFFIQLISSFENLDQKNLFSEVMQGGDFTEARMVKEIIAYSNKYMCDEIDKYNQEKREYQEYIELWVHEIKTPITSSLLLIENNIDITTLSIRDELHSISRYVEQVLFYARSNALEKDFRLDQVMLSELVIAAVKSYSKPIIKVGGEIELNYLELCVLADKKWCQFIIEQIIANSVKYRRDNLKIKFTGSEMEDKVILSIRDNGIGIPVSDRNKVFEKGFVGGNGRENKRSTGLGLYLCKCLCEKMNIQIEVNSEYGKWTEMQLSFYGVKDANMTYK